MVNKAILLGYVGKVYEMRHTSGGDPVANLSLATTEKWTSKTGQKQEKTEWHRLVAFNPLATVVNNYIKKGSKIYIEGKLQTSEWEKDGIKRRSTEIVVRELKMLDNKSDATTPPQPEPQPTSEHPPAREFIAQQGTVPIPTAAADGADDDEVPF